MAKKNPIYTQAQFDDSRAKSRMGRVDLLSKDVADDLNTYKNFGVFKSYANSYIEKVDKDGNPDGKGEDGKPDHPGTPGVRSLFNKYSAVLTGTNDPNWEGKPMKDVVANLVETSSRFRISTNTPLLDSPETRRRLKAQSGCTVRELVQASQKGYFGRAVYSYADFMYCRHLGKVPNNYLITLRRFPTPVADTIVPMGTGADRKDMSDANTFSPIGTMVTWLGVSGNDMEQILKYSYAMPFEEKQAQWNEVEKKGGTEGILNGLEAAINKNTRRLAAGGAQVDALTANSGMFGKLNKYLAVGAGFPIESKMRDQTKIYGPIDRIKSNYRRGEGGLDHKMSFSLTFEYELRAYNGINPRQAMIDLIASILAVTYTTGNFWGGGYNSAFISQSSAFQNLSIFKCNGGFTDFMDAFIDSASTVGEQIKQGLGIKDGDSFVTMAKKAINSIGGMLMGGLLNKAGRPARYFANSLLSDAPVGLWHITIGNPHHPIMSMGNMILKNTTIEHSGPLGIDDFPTRLKVTCEFDRGKPRDLRGIEAMYMGGNDRVFHSMEGALSHMYNVATIYKHKGKKDVTAASVTGVILTPGELVPVPDSGTKPKVEKTSNGDAMVKNARKSMMEINDLEVLDYYFGNMDDYAVVSASSEQGHGMSKKKPEKKDDKGDGDQQGGGDKPAK